MGIGRAVALHYCVAPIEEVDGVVRLVAAREMAPAAIAEIAQLTGAKVAVATVSDDLFRRRLAEVYGVGVAALSEEQPPPQPHDPIQPVEAGIVRFVDALIAETLRHGATDLHVEPSVGIVRVRVRVDGLLAALPVPPELAAHSRRIVARIKVMAGLDSTPSQLPKEGTIRAGGRDFRLSVLPTPVGEAVHLRVLPEEQEFRTLEDLGVPPEAGSRLVELMRQRSGLVVTSGPTGSGKSTTLHVLLRATIPGTEKIITVEDPVEFRLPGTVQVEVTPQLSFAQALRAVLRHDPDVILIGEMRDAESAAIAMQAALTGHLVLTSLHTDDEAQAVTRLLQLGMDRRLLAAALRAVVTQRLLRRVCTACGGESTRVTACAACRGTGFQGRIGLFRVTTVDPTLRSAVVSGATEEEVRERIEAAGGQSLRAMGRRLVREGVTTDEEVVRVLGTGR